MHDLTKKELVDIARSNGCTGYSTLKKADLITLISKNCHPKRSKKDLVDLAKARGCVGYSKLNKPDLVEFLKTCSKKSKTKSKTASKKSKSKSKSASKKSNTKSKPKSKSKKSTKRTTKNNSNESSPRPIPTAISSTTPKRTTPVSNTPRITSPVSARPSPVSSTKNTTLSARNKTVSGGDGFPYKSISEMKEGETVTYQVSTDDYEATRSGNVITYLKNGKKLNKMDLNTNTSYVWDGRSWRERKKQEKYKDPLTDIYPKFKEIKFGETTTYTVEKNTYSVTKTKLADVPDVQNFRDFQYVQKNPDMYIVNMNGNNWRIKGINGKDLATWGMLNNVPSWIRK